ncbi:type II toxin-antitoxin system HicA family toxin [Erwinia sp. V71]|uniref:type II toxin-antitoxin system HicA family toxin n=1 Tax=Erwinia sp. V71 TaxID=3369424 RepID=UPI003F5E4B41
MKTLSARHSKTLHTIFATPTSNTLEWRKIESLFIALGAITTEGNGSRVRFEINQVVASFHRPHPEKEAKAYQVRDARDFLIAIEVIPNEYHDI